MRFVSWNVRDLKNNSKTLKEYIKGLNVDILCLQGVTDKKEIENLGRFQYWNPSEDMVIVTKEDPKGVSYGMGNQNGVVTMDWDLIYVVNFKVPEQLVDGLERAEWYDSFIHYVSELISEKPVIICGSLNVPNNDGLNNIYVDQEALDDLLSVGLTDTFNFFNTGQDNTTWWPNGSDNPGYNTDFVLASDVLDKWLLGASIKSKDINQGHALVIMDIM